MKQISGKAFIISLSILCLIGLIIYFNVMQGKVHSVLVSSVGYEKTGNASWYSMPGQKTASGEKQVTSDLTAASPDLPLGSRVRVTNLSNGKSVEVKITDRGPFTGDRLIDLSPAAARQIDFIEKGVTKVKVEGLGP